MAPKANISEPRQDSPISGRMAPKATLSDLRQEMRDRELKATAEPMSPAEAALRNLFKCPPPSVDIKDPGYQQRLKDLGIDTNPKYLRSRRDGITTMHHDLAKDYQKNKDAAGWTQQGVLDHLVEKYRKKLGDLFARGEEGFTILHVILNPATYAEKDGFEEFHCDRVMPLIRFLLQLHPNLATAEANDQKGPPIFKALEAKPEDDPDRPVFGDKQKKAIVSFLCDGGEGKLGSPEALKSLGQIVSSDRHALHMAIESSDFEISDNVMKKLGGVKSDLQDKTQKSCLEIRDKTGRSCLHIALTAPITKQKAWWAKKLAELQPDLLKATYKDEKSKKGALTPLQFFTDEIGVKSEGPKADSDVGAKETNECTTVLKLEKLEELEADLKRRCLVNFEPGACEHIMYKKGCRRRIFLTLQEAVSWKLLKSRKRHYKLDTLLREVHIRKSVSVRWGDEGSITARNTATSWDCAGNYGLFMIFEWLRKEARVKKILEVIVEDGASGGMHTDDLTVSQKPPHSDKAIVECLSGLDVEIFDWQRGDIPAKVILSAAPNAREVYLYCSGLQAVLQGWADTNGLAKLTKLEKVIVKIQQGLESFQDMTTHAEDFERALQATYKEAHNLKETDESPLVIQHKVLPARRQPSGTEFTASHMKNVNEQGFQEQDWLKCMDEFADIMDQAETSIITKFGSMKRNIRVALIDDGVQTSYAGLDDNVADGKSDWPIQPGLPKVPAVQRGCLHDYDSSHTGHGTVMAYYIKRVCPKVHLYVAKLHPKPNRGGTSGDFEKVTFSCDSAAEAIKWAVEECEVDIISMSWAVDENVETAKTALRGAIQSAVDANVLLFCANPDRGPDYKINKTLPKDLNPDHVFCIGAATQDGHRWQYIDEEDSSCNYFLPGVELGIQVESTSKSLKVLEEPPKEWRKYSGSSLSCALAAGLAAMILHCMLITRKAKEPNLDDKDWKWLRSQDGMNSVFKHIQVDPTDSGWLPVRKLFGDAVKNSAGREAKRLEAVETLVRELLDGRKPQGRG